MEKEEEVSKDRFTTISNLTTPPSLLKYPKQCDIKSTKDIF
jgi:hypothetical protein